jgi:hypothetical protein
MKAKNGQEQKLLGNEFERWPGMKRFKEIRMEDGQEWKALRK